MAHGRLTTKDRVDRHIFEGGGERCDVCGFRRAYFVHNAPNSGQDWQHDFPEAELIAEHDRREHAEDVFVDCPKCSGEWDAITARAEADSAEDVFNMAQVHEFEKQPDCLTCPQSRAWHARHAETLRRELGPEAELRFESEHPEAERDYCAKCGEHRDEGVHDPINGQDELIAERYTGRKDSDMATSEIRYAGFVIREGVENGKPAWRVLDESGFANVAPGATYGRSEEEAMQIADVLRAVDGDAQKFWHLLRAIQRQQLAPSILLDEHRNGQHAEDVFVDCPKCSDEWEQITARPDTIVKADVNLDRYAAVLDEVDLFGEMLDVIAHVTSTGYELVISRPANGADSYRAAIRKPGQRTIERDGMTITEALRLLRSSAERADAIVKARR